MIQSFSYRSPRLAVHLPVEFLTEQDLLFGFMRDISDHGILVAFGEPVMPNTLGRVRFRSGHCLLELKAEVAHSEGFLSGLVFAFSSPRESLFIHAILQALADAADPSETLT